MGLKQQAIGGVKWTTVSTVVGSLMQLIQVVVLTRFLDKKDFGLMAMALFVIGISKIFIDMGISNAIIYKQKVNKYQLSTLFWLNIILGAIIFLAIIGASPFIAQFYDTPALKGVVDWVAVTFLIIPLGQQFEALLRKDLRFKILAIQDISGRTIGLIVSIILAIYGYGVYALVYANIAAVSVTVLVQSFVGFKDYCPAFIFTMRSLNGKGFFSFGLFQIGERGMNYLNSNFDTILIGKLVGMEALGLYNIAKILALKPYQIINPIINKVAFPVFSKLQDDTLKLKSAYLKIINLLTSSNAPVYLIMILFAYPLIHLVFGDDWITAAPILQLLAIGGLCNSIGNPIGSLQLAKGRADMGFYWNLTLFFFTPISIWIGSYWGLIGVATSLAILKIAVTIYPVWAFFVRKLCNASFIEYFISYAKPITIALFSAAPILLVLILTKDFLLQLLIGIPLFLLIYIILSYFLNKLLFNEFKEAMPRWLTSLFRFKS